MFYTINNKNDIDLDNLEGKESIILSGVLELCYRLFPKEAIFEKKKSEKPRSKASQRSIKK